jgi:hypothetical protein
MPKPHPKDEFGTQNLKFYLRFIRFRYKRSLEERRGKGSDALVPGTSSWVGWVLG